MTSNETLSNTEMKIHNCTDDQQQSRIDEKKNPFDWIPVIETRIAVDYRGKYAGDIVDEEMIDNLPDYPRNTPTEKM